MIAMGFQAILSCVEGKVGLGSSGGRTTNVCCETCRQGSTPAANMASFIVRIRRAGFRRPVAVEVGETVIRDGRYYADLLLAESAELWQLVPRPTFRQSEKRDRSSRNR